jgi:hypothetical protein
VFMAVGDWYDEENDAIVADYFAMLCSELDGRSVNKADRNRALQQSIGRGRGSIEYKHQNISAVLKGLGETWISGYKPAFNYQLALERAVVRWLAAHPDWLQRIDRSGGDVGLSEGRALWVGPPPTFSNAPPPAELEQTLDVARRYDVAERDARNRILGRAGEKLVLEYERQSLESAGRSDLAKQVRWISEEEGDGAGFDIASFDPSGSPRLIEVKTTNGWERTPFHISANELAVADRRQAEWRLLRLWNFAREPRAFELQPPLAAHVSLMPTSFRADFHTSH